MKKFLLMLLTVFCLSISVTAQENLEAWMLQNQDVHKNGVGALATYEDFIKDKEGNTVIVAVLDSGVDIDHEDLKENIWVNQDEIPDNGIDDDQNGYIDDVNGWNFIGGPDGKHVDGETLEITRFYAYYRDKYQDINPTKLEGDEKMEYARYLAYKKEVERKRENASRKYDEIAPIVSTIDKAFEALTEELNATYYNQTTLDTLQSASQLVLIGKSVLGQVLLDSGEDSLHTKEVMSGLLNQLYEERDYYENKVFYQYNPDYDSRQLIVKDDYENGNEKYYGNNDVEGPHARHGTHVAGIIGAIRDNKLGINGIANHVLIMPVKIIPDGDERDKDVANGIRYAVDNGASIINMSFGKGLSWDKDLVDDAVKYAAEHDVLIVHASGNEGIENTRDNNFPNDQYNKTGFFLFPDKEADNWIEVGALSYESDTNSVASFSNYSAEYVDIFAPGELIYSTTPGDTYEFLNGTSMAAPVVSGIAAVIRSYFPTLTAEQIIEILKNSATKEDIYVYKPGSKEVVHFNSLSTSGGKVNLYEAFKLALKTKGKKKIKKKFNQDRV